MTLNKILLIIFLNIIIISKASAFSTEIYKDKNIIVNKISDPKEIDSFSDKMNPINDENKDGIKTLISGTPTSFTGNITIRGADKGCFNSNVEIYAFDSNKQIRKNIINFKRSENPYPSSLSYCFFGSTSMPEYVSKFHENLFFINNYGISYYNFKSNNKINLPLLLNETEQKSSVIYTIPYHNNLLIVVENININKDFYEVILN